jgi:hypothetical protein
MVNRDFVSQYFAQRCRLFQTTELRQEPRSIEPPNDAGRNHLRSADPHVGLHEHDSQWPIA